MNSYHPYLRIAQSLSSIILPIMPSCKKYTSIQFFLLIIEMEERPVYISCPQNQIKEIEADVHLCAILPIHQEGE